ncbi:MAG TPA: hypothetical protein VFL92_05975 [Sphingomonas sp.]|nr:hypothetical protein [Sphingomonas sp.]
MRPGPAIFLGVLLTLAACGKKDDLRPAVGQSLPPKAATSPTRPGVADLLAPTSQARPSRDDELVKRSKPLEPDRFDLPPPG